MVAKGGATLGLMASVSFPEILRLSVSERLELATAIWESIVSEPDSLPLTEDQRREILRRSEAHRKNPEDAIPVEESLERIRRSL
jgi:putative addiction module component (TIGR02574 family)